MKHNLCMRTIALTLVLLLLIPMTANAAVNETVAPCASYYLDLYNTYICPMGNGKLQIWFEVMGTGYMDEIGTLKIMLYESSDNVNWTWKKTYLHEDYSSMLETNDYHHSSYVSYNGTAGRYYKAYVCIWAGKNGSGDTRYMWATSVRAT